MPDFNDTAKLGSEMQMVDRLTKLIAVFENPALDFFKNRADGDDILQDAYEHLMRHFATESGKSKGQLYTPAEVSRATAKVIGIAPNNTTTLTSAHDPTCGSGSLLLKIADEANKYFTLWTRNGQFYGCFGPDEYDSSQQAYRRNKAGKYHCQSYFPGQTGEA